MRIFNLNLWVIEYVVIIIDILNYLYRLVLILLFGLWWSATSLMSAMQPWYSHLLLLLEPDLIWVVLSTLMPLVSSQSMVIILMFSLSTIASSDSFLLRMSIFIWLLAHPVWWVILLLLVLLINYFTRVILVILYTFPLKVFWAPFTGLVEIQRLRFRTLFFFQILVFRCFKLFSVWFLLFTFLTPLFNRWWFTIFTGDNHIFFRRIRFLRGFSTHTWGINSGILGAYCLSTW